MKKYILSVFLLIALKSVAQQDPQFSQFYAAPLYQNPAFAGSVYAPRAIANYRNQWPSIGANYGTMAFSLDHYFERLNSGVGILVMNDTQGQGVLKRTEVSGIYSYQIKLTDDNFVRMGVQGTYGNIGANLANLTFPDQYDNRGLKPIGTNDPLATLTSSINFVDYSAGALFYNDKLWVGTTLNHIGNLYKTTSTLAVMDKSMKFSLTGGMKIRLDNSYASSRAGDKEFSISPTFHYKRQGKFNQFDLGFYTTYSPITLGVWYRGIPFLTNGTNTINSDAIVALLGMRFDNFSFGYSYDFTVSDLGTSTGGAHEISIAYQLEPFDNGPRNKRRRKKELSCPKF